MSVILPPQLLASETKQTFLFINPACLLAFEWQAARPYIISFGNTDTIRDNSDLYSIMSDCIRQTYRVAVAIRKEKLNWVFGRRTLRAIDSKVGCGLNIKFIFPHSLKFTSEVCFLFVL